MIPTFAPTAADLRTQLAAAALQHEAVLRASTSARLIDDLVALTHTIERCADPVTASELGVQRARVLAEIERRAAAPVEGRSS